MKHRHCVKRVCIRSYSSPHFSRIFPHLDWIRRDIAYISVFSPNAGKCVKNTDQNDSKYGLFLCLAVLCLNFEGQTISFMYFNGIAISSAWDKLNLHLNNKLSALGFFSLFLAVFFSIRSTIFAHDICLLSCIRNYYTQNVSLRKIP